MILDGACLKRPAVIAVAVCFFAVVRFAGLHWNVHEARDIRSPSWCLFC